MSTSYEVERDVVRQKVAALWSTTTPIAWDGFNLGGYDRSEGVAFIRPRIEDGENAAVGIGGNSARHRRFSTLVIEIYHPASQGQETAMQRIDTLATGLFRYAASGVHFWRLPFIVEAGADGKFFKWLLFAPYYVEENA